MSINRPKVRLSEKVLARQAEIKSKRAVSEFQNFQTVKVRESEGISYPPEKKDWILRVYSDFTFDLNTDHYELTSSLDRVKVREMRSARANFRFRSFKDGNTVYYYAPEPFKPSVIVFGNNILLTLNEKVFDLNDKLPLELFMSHLKAAFQEHLLG